LIKPNPLYRPNPQRAIYVQGKIDQSLLDKLTPQIINLQHASRDPITAYIDSPGGNTLHQQTLSRLVSASDQDLSNRCSLITVVTGRAASAAADFLCSASYATAMSGTSVFFHGGRSLIDDPITVAVASFVIESLRSTNERYAMLLAETALKRFGFRIISNKKKSADYRQKIGKLDLEELPSFLGVISPRLSSNAKKVVKRAEERNKRYTELIDRVSRIARRSKRFTNPKRMAEVESAIIKGIVDFELSRNKRDKWSFARGGLSQLNADFLLVNEYISIYDSAHLKTLCEGFGQGFLTAEHKAELETMAEPDRTTRRDEILKPMLRPLWLFFVALCYELQEGENDLTAVDVFLLGLIDEIIGGPADLHPVRLVLEYEEDPSVNDDQEASALPVSPANAVLPAPAALP
jgi:ATP-dependent protease ClpP protease subunit